MCLEVAKKYDLMIISFGIEIRDLYDSNYSRLRL